MPCCKAIRGQAQDEHRPAAGTDRAAAGLWDRAEHRQPRGRLRLGAYHVNLAAAAVLIGVVSVTLSLVGLELGNRLGNKTGERGELIGGLVLIAVGIAIASGVL